MRAALYPVPAPSSRMRSPGWASSWSSMRATTLGWDAQEIDDPSASSFTSTTVSA